MRPGPAVGSDTAGTKVRDINMGPGCEKSRVHHFGHWGLLDHFSRTMLEVFLLRAESIEDNRGLWLQVWYQLTLFSVGERSARALQTTWAVALLCSYCYVSCILLFCICHLSCHLFVDFLQGLGGLVESSLPGYVLTRIAAQTLQLA